MTLKRLASFLFVAVLLVGVVSISSFAYGTSELSAESGIETEESKDLIWSLEEIQKLENVKENIFNNMLNSVDHYDAVEGEFTTTLITDEGEAVVSYATDIPNQKSYQKITEAGKSTEVVANDGMIYSFDNSTRTYRITNADLRIELEERVRVSNSVLESVDSNVNFRTSIEDVTKRVGNKDGVPIYYYRTDLTNTGYASASIFPQELTFALLSDQNNWEIANTTYYLGRRAIIIQGTVKDSVYAEKIGSVEFQLIVDLESGIILEFRGFDVYGNETESLKTTEINFIENNARSSLTRLIESKLADCADYTSVERGMPIVDSMKSMEEKTDDNEDRTISMSSWIACTIDNDTSDRNDYFNERYGFTAYLNDSNYYNGDMRRALSNSNDNYAWYMYDGPLIVPFEEVSLNLMVYLYSSTANDSAAMFTADSTGYETCFITNMNQGLAPNGWSSYSRSFSFKNGNPNTYFLGLSLRCSGTGTGYTGADAVDFTFRY